MFEGLQESNLQPALEALLFISDTPVDVLTLSEMLESDTGTVERALDGLRAALEEGNRGVQLREVAGGWRLYTHPAYHDLLEKYVASWDTRRLSSAMMETLAVVAYSQPVTRSGVAAVRGVTSDSSINALLERGLLREAGTADTPGNPTLYVTSRTFLEKFGLRSVDDLPDLAQFAPDQDTAELIRERLSATRVDDADEDQGDEESPLGDLSFTFEDDDEQVAVLREAARSMMGDALAAQAGLVEKIDFDTLVFEDGDE